MGTEKPKLLIDIQKQIYYYQVCLIGCILVFLYLCVLSENGDNSFPGCDCNSMHKPYCLVSFNHRENNEVFILLYDI